GIRAASQARARCSAWRSARRLPGEPLAPTMTRRGPDMALVLPFHGELFTIQVTPARRERQGCPARPEAYFCRLATIASAELTGLTAPAVQRSRKRSSARPDS